MLTIFEMSFFILSRGRRFSVHFFYLLGRFFLQVGCNYVIAKYYF